MPIDQQQVDNDIVEGVVGLLDGAPVEALAPTAFSDALGHLFQRLLDDAPGWKRGWWIDGALAGRAEVIDNDTVSLAGTFVPADDRDQWIQPFKADLTVDERRVGLAGYHIRLGEAGMLMNAVPYHRPRKHWPDARAWAFEFRSPRGSALELSAWRTWYKRAGERQLRQVLLEHWDPIGVGKDSPSEYDAYLLQIAGLLRRDGTAGELEGLLRSIAVHQIGMTRRPERDREAALAIQAWYVEAMRDAEARAGDVSHRPAPPAAL